MKWSNVPGAFHLEIGRFNGAVRRLDTDKAIECLEPFVGFFPRQADEGDLTLVVNWRSSGYYDPGSMYGGRDNLGHPPEGEDERTLDDAYLLRRVRSSEGATWDNKRIDLPKPIQSELFDLLLEEIEEQVVEYEH